jgi:hypothetical protein
MPLTGRKNPLFGNRASRDRGAYSGRRGGLQANSPAAANGKKGGSHLFRRGRSAAGSRRADDGSGPPIGRNGRGRGGAAAEKHPRALLCPPPSVPPRSLRLSIQPARPSPHGRRAEGLAAGPHWAARPWPRPDPRRPAAPTRAAGGAPPTTPPGRPAAAGSRSDPASPTPTGDADHRGAGVCRTGGAPALPPPSPLPPGHGKAAP